MDAISEVAVKHGLYLVEDCAQALGAEYRGRKIGSLGTAGCFSFFPSKNLGCYGDGGMVVTNDPGVYERVEMLRRHGGRVKYHHTELGVNSRLDELQAAVLRVKLPYLDKWNIARRHCAYRYNRLFAASPHVKRPKEYGCDEVITAMDICRSRVVQSTYHQYTILVEEREALRESLKQSGISSAAYYPVPLHLQEVHRDLGYQAGDFPNAEEASQQCLSLPLYPELSEERIAIVTGAVIKSLEEQAYSLS